MTLQLPTDSTTTTVNREGILLDTSAQIINEHTMAPLRFVAEQFALQIQ
ncbi:MAG: stalk domain-containing protein [Peptococcaceae bacterium]